MSAWADAGFALRTLRQLPVHRLGEHRQHWSVLDVRSPQEWARGHVPGARHVFLPELPHALGTLDRNAPVAVYCDSGYRASLGASLLQARGFEAASVPGSWQAWKAQRMPVQTPSG